MVHDDNPLCNNGFGNFDSSKHVMSATMDRIDSAQPWSQCSRKAIIYFLQDKRGECLRDRPQRPKVNCYPNDGNFGCMVTKIYKKVSMCKIYYFLFRFLQAYPTTLPGKTYNMDEQCAMAFGVGAVTCPWVDWQDCRLWCQVPNKRYVAPSDPAKNAW